MATHFSRLLRHAWVTVGLFLFPGHHTGMLVSLVIKIFSHLTKPIIRTLSLSLSLLKVRVICEGTRKPGVSRVSFHSVEPQPVDGNTGHDGASHCGCQTLA
jgi:hypothetical protein